MASLVPYDLIFAGVKDLAASAECIVKGVMVPLSTDHMVDDIMTPSVSVDFVIRGAMDITMSSHFVVKSVMNPTSAADLFCC